MEYYADKEILFFPVKVLKILTMKIKIITSYKSVYPDPLILNPGDEVLLGKEEKKEEWLGWIYRKYKGNIGWVPKDIIKSEDGVRGVITEYYSAKELDVSEGEILDQIKSLYGWHLLKNQKGETGWVPQENTEQLSS